MRKRQGILAGFFAKYAQTATSAETVHFEKDLGPCMASAFLD